MTESRRHIPTLTASEWHPISSNPEKNVVYRVITIEQARQEAKDLIDKYYVTNPPATNNEWKNKIPRLETGGKFLQSVTAASIVAIDLEEFSLPGDKMGIFIAQKKETIQRAGKFFENLLESSIRLTQSIHSDLYHNEEYIYKTLQNRHGSVTRDEYMTLKYSMEQSNTRGRPAPTDEEEENFLGLATLVSELSGILSVTSEGRDRNKSLPYKEKPLRQKHFSQLPPATVKYDVENTLSGNVMEITVVGLPDTKYQGKGNYRFNGAMPQDVKIWLHENIRDGRRADEIDEIVSNAEEEMIPPHIELSLYFPVNSDEGEERIPISKINAALVRNSKETALILTSEGFPNISDGFILKGYVFDSENPLYSISQDIAKLRIP